MNFAIILAAGDSKRISGTNKLFFKIKGKPLIFYTLHQITKHSQIQKIILVAKKENFPRLSFLIKKYKLKKISMIVEGGRKRQDSVFNGLKAVQQLKAKQKDLVLIHNGANPLVSSKEITQTIKAGKKYKAALVATSAKDTIKKVDRNGFVVKTLDRRRIFLAQTPQVIEYQLAKKVFDKAKKQKFYSTDDVSLVEKSGIKPKIIQANPKNIKITYPEDLKFIKNQLKNGKT